MLGMGLPMPMIGNNRGGYRRWNVENNAVVVVGTSLAYGQGSTGAGTDAGGLSGRINDVSGYIAHQIGYPGQNSTYIADNWLVDGLAYRSWTTLLWICANNVGQVSVCLADLARMVSVLHSVGNDRFLVLLEYPSQISASNGTFAQWETLDNALISAYPDNYYDTRPNFATKAPGVPEDAYVVDGPNPGLHPNDVGYDRIFELAGVDGLIARIEQLPLAPPDTNPETITFPTLIGVALSATATSSSVAITGINTSVPISTDIGEYQINGGSWTSSPGTIVNGDTLALRHEASSSLFTNTIQTIIVGDGLGTFTSTTVSSAELVLNGDFATDTIWTKTNTTISGGAAHFSAASFGNVRQNIAFVAGKTYRVTYTILNYVGGSARVLLFGGTTVNGTLRNGNGTFTQDMVALTGNTSFRIAGQTASDTFDVDNVSVFQLD